MPISSYIYDLKPQSGDTTAHNELGGAQALSPTPTLVDLGGGTWSWEVAAASMATITSRTITNTGAATGGGATLAITYCVVTPPPAGDDRIVSWGSTTSPTDGPALQIRRGNAGATYRYPVYRESGSTLVFGTEVNEGNSSTTLRTLVIRWRTNTGTGEALDQWSSLGGTANTPDATTSSASALGTPAFQYLHIGASGSQTVRVHRLTIWPEELTDAECNSIRQNHNGAMSDTTAPTLSSPTGTGGVLTCSGTVSTNEGNGTLYAVVTASATAPTAAQVKAGQDNAGAAALRVASQAVSATGTQTIASGSVTAGTRYFHYMHEDAAANQSAVVSSSSFTVSASGDTTPPVLSSPVGTATGATTATVGATTDEGNGTLYAVVTSSATQPTVAQIKAGQSNTGAAASWSGSQAISSTGAKTLSATGLTASTTYYAHLVHTDAAGNDSNRVSSASFTTSAVTGSVTLGPFASSGTLWPSGTTIHYEWQQGGRIGSAPTSTTRGTATLGAGGTVAVSGLPSGAGFALVAKRVTAATDDEVAYQPGTVT